MRSDISEVERTLPRRDYGDPQCVNPWCSNSVRIKGEHCKSCLHIQQLQREALRASGQKGASA